MATKKTIKEVVKKVIKGNVCPNCDGSGRSGETDDCGNCKGKGTVNDVSIWVKNPL